MKPVESAVQSIVLNYVDPSALNPDKKERVLFSNIIPFGNDNLFPQAIALISRTSPNHRGIINSKTRFMIGGGITSKNELPIIDKANAEGESLNKVIRKWLLDDNTFGNAYAEIITDLRSFIFLNHIDATKVRLSKESNDAILHPDWPQDTGNNDSRRVSISLYPEFVPDLDTKGLYRSIYHFKQYEPEFTYYGVPVWLAGKDSANIDFKTNKWNLSRLENSFRVSGILIVPVTDKSEGKEVLDNIKKNFIGQDKQAKLLTITKTRARENEKADTTQLIETKQDDDGSWIDLHKQSLSDVVVSHGWYRSLTGIPDTTGFDTRRILNEYSMALSTSIMDKQSIYVDFLKQIYRDILRKEIDIAFVNKPPLDDDTFMFIWEIRQKRGLDFDPSDPKQQEIYLGQTQIKPTQNAGNAG